MSNVLTIVAASLIGVGLASATFALQAHRAGREDAERPPSQVTGSATTVITSVGAFVVGWIVGSVISGIFIFGLPIAAMAATIPNAVRSRRRAGQRRRARAAWPDALRLLNASLMAGVPIHLAMLRLEREGPQILAPFWSRYRRLAATADPAAALVAMKADQDDPFVDRLVEVLVQAMEAGPSVAVELMSELATNLSEELILELHIEGANLEQRINSRVVGYMPAAILLLIGFSNEQYAAFYRSAAGSAVVVAGTLISLAGLFVVDLLSRQATEERILTVGELA